jgi:hypothetical protein
MKKVAWFLAVLLSAGCMTCSPEGGSSDDAFKLLLIPQKPVGTCEKGPFRGDFMESAPPKGSVRVALKVGNVLSRGRSIRVILDSVGRPVSFRDELVYDTLGTSIGRSISVAFTSDGSVRSGMEHHHERKGEISSTDKDRDLSTERYAAVVQAVRQLRERCGA